MVRKFRRVIMCCNTPLEKGPVLNYRAYQNVSEAVLRLFKFPFTSEKI